MCICIYVYREREREGERETESELERERERARDEWFSASGSFVESLKKTPYLSEDPVSTAMEKTDSMCMRLFVSVFVCTYEYVQKHNCVYIYTHI